MLIYCEGQAEAVFLKYLRSLYSFNVGVNIIIKKGKGGTAHGIINGAINYMGDFDLRVAVIDNDKSKKEMDEARKKAKDRSIKLIENTPCLESLLLVILGDGNNMAIKSSARCKSEFEKRYIERQQRGELLVYKKVFPKSLLNRARKTVVELDKIISLMEGKS
jgi:hypothetical protein